ncbi:NAD-dependent epimerase/dehydratase family protein [Undibacterium sp. RuTC16W]|uniref:NAD-dependent epimerase/dehydratase family protein n=1 Tax=Undibacterium sp. RuTC16W TaxID=3413048 RepID=UPI003BF108A0
MIIGNGLLARAFAPLFASDARHLIFASGVSNSLETNAEAFAREKVLLTSALTQNKTTVYFSTCSVYDPKLTESPYVRHKIEMEELVLNAGAMTVFRLPQVVGKTNNPHTLTNYLHQQISSRLPFKIWRHARRNLIDVQDVSSIATYLLRHQHTANQIINIANPLSTSIQDLVKIFENTLDIQALCEVLESGASYDIEATIAIRAASCMGIHFDHTYVNNLIRKYYA